MKFKQLRKSKKISQTEIAKILNLKKCTVSSWECGRSLPSTTYYQKIAEALGVTIYDILDCFV